MKRLFNKLIIFVLIATCATQAYIILKMKRATGTSSISGFVEDEFKKDTERASDLFDQFLSDTSYKGKPLKNIKRPDVGKKIKPIQKKFDTWYTKKFGDSNITHTTKVLGNKIVVTVLIPSVRKESVDVTISDDIIKLSGELKAPKNKRFEHSILMPENADTKNSKVEFDAGANKLDIIFDMKL